MKTKLIILATLMLVSAFAQAQQFGNYSRNQIVETARLEILRDFGVRGQRIDSRKIPKEASSFQIKSESADSLLAVVSFKTSIIASVEFGTTYICWSKISVRENQMVPVETECVEDFN